MKPRRFGLLLGSGWRNGPRFGLLLGCAWLMLDPRAAAAAPTPSRLPASSPAPSSPAPSSSATAPKAGTASAQGSAAAGSQQLTLEAAADLGGMEARLSEGTVSYRRCPVAGCLNEPWTALPLPTVRSPAPMEVLELSEGPRVLWGHGDGVDWLLAPHPQDTDKVTVLFAGATGLRQGEAGERTGKSLRVQRTDTQNARVLLGDVREDLDLCGRPTLLSPTVLGADLSFHAAKVQQLATAERASAQVLTAVRTSPPSPRATHSLLRATAASSAIGSPAAVTDGDENTFWSEARSGDGMGEFVQMRAPDALDISAIDLTFRPKMTAVSHGAAPRKLWLATSKSLFAVQLPEDGWTTPGATYRVTLPSPVHDRCWSLVLDEAYATSQGRAAQVTFSEVQARTSLDDGSPEEWVLALSTERSSTAAELLRAQGDASVGAISAHYAELPLRGKIVALDLLDEVSCAQSSPVYVRALTSGVDVELRHARERLLRCGREAAPALVGALATASPDTRALLAEQLAWSAPDKAVSELLPFLGPAAPAEKAQLRAALHHAAAQPVAREAVLVQTSRSDLPPATAVELMRAWASVEQAQPGVRALFTRLTEKPLPFAETYLLLEPAAALASSADVEALAFVRRSGLAHSEPHLRAHGALVSGKVPQLRTALREALKDPEPRVRQSACLALAQQAAPPESATTTAGWADAVTALDKLLREEPWTFVRLDAARALTSMPASPDADRALGRLLNWDAAPTVRAQACLALGARRALTFAERVRERATDEQEAADVRVAAISALGTMCDSNSLDLLTKLTARAAGPSATPTEQALGSAALGALGDLRPADLVRRLQPAVGSDALPFFRQQAQQILRQSGKCSDPRRAP